MAREKRLDLAVVEAWLAAWGRARPLFRCRRSPPSVLDPGCSLPCRRHTGCGQGAAQLSVPTAEVRAACGTSARLPDHRAKRMEEHGTCEHRRASPFSR
jgi:hypothetical protein